MIQLFRDATRDLYRQQGKIGLLSWWLSTILDLIVTVIEQRKEGKLNDLQTNRRSTS